MHPGRSARNHLLFLALVGLQDVADKRAGGFALGMSQRLGVAVAMLVTADHLIVIGRGKLITEASTEDVIARSTDKSVRCAPPTRTGSPI